MSGQGPAVLPANISPPTGLVTAMYPANGLLRITLPTATADQTMLPPDWVPHRTTALTAEPSRCVELRSKARQATHTHNYK